MCEKTTAPDNSFLLTHGSTVLALAGLISEIEQPANGLLKLHHELEENDRFRRQPDIIL